MVQIFSKRPWSLCIIFFILLMTLGPLIPFILGRIMTIQTMQRVRIYSTYNSLELMVSSVYRISETITGKFPS